MGVQALAIVAGSVLVENALALFGADFEEIACAGHLKPITCSETLWSVVLERLVRAGHH